MGASGSISATFGRRSESAREYAQAMPTMPAPTTAMSTWVFIVR